MSDAAQWLSQAWEHYQAGEFHHAEQLCRQILQADAGEIGALHLLAALAQQTGQPDQALAYLHQALNWQPTHPQCHFQLGLHYDSLGKADLAVESFLGSLRLQPDFPEAHNNLATVLQRMGRYEEAADHLLQALALRPHYANAYLNLGAVRAEQGRFDEAVACYRWVLHLEPQSAGAYCNLGIVLEKLGKLDEAAACYETARQLRPDMVEPVFNLGNVLHQQERFDEAVAYYRAALQVQPNHPQAHNNLGIVLAKLSRPDEAVEHYQTALRLVPHYVEALINLGAALVDLGQPGEAERRYDEALRLAPRDADAHKHRAFLWLLQGRFSEGWPEYEWRWLSGQSLPHFDAPRWDGSDLAGRTILLFAEQGLGDTLQFIRYAPLIQKRGARVIVQCQPALQQLLASCAGIDRLVVRGAPLPPFDVQAPLLSLPGIVGTTLPTVPAEVPYLRADARLVAYWRDRLQSGPPFKVGIIWQGSPGFAADRQRSVPLAEFAPLAAIPEVKLISLQKGHGREQIANLPSRFRMLDLGDQLDEESGPFMDTAAIMHNLNLVIAPNTAIAHLAGALAVRVWIALPTTPEWRWLTDRSDSPWYPTARLFRQQRAGDWSTVFAQIAQEIRKVFDIRP